MAIEEWINQQMLKGLAFALDEARPGATLEGEWALNRQKTFEVCGEPGHCWNHGMEHRNWSKMAEAATRGGTSMYELFECYGGDGAVYYGVGAAEHDGEKVQLRSFVEHTFSHGSYCFICVVWTLGSNGVMTVNKSAAGYSGCYPSATEFHTLPTMEERHLPPPLEIKFDQ